MFALWIVVDTEVRTGTLGHMCYLDCIDVARAASEVDLLHGTLWSLMWAVIVV